MIKISFYPRVLGSCLDSNNNKYHNLSADRLCTKAAQLNEAIQGRVTQIATSKICINLLQYFINDIIGLMVQLLWSFWGCTYPIGTARLFCVPLGWSWFNSKQWHQWITWTFTMIVLWSHMFSTKLTAITFSKNN